MTSRLNLVLGGVSLLYPVIALVGLKFFQPVWIVAALIGVLILRLMLGQRAGTPIAMVLAALAAVLALSVATLINPDLAVRLYPVFMTAAMLAAFAHSLVRPPSMIERFARIAEPDLPPEGVTYTRQVTWVWVAFLVVNLGLAVYTSLFASLELWALYNGGVSYVLMGLLFGGEVIVRHWVKRKQGQALKTDGE